MKNITIKILFFALVFLLFFQGCKTRVESINQVPVNDFPFYEVAVDKLPLLQSVKGLLVMAYNHPSIPCYMLLIGDRKEVEGIVGFELFGRDMEPVKVEKDTSIIETIYYDLKQNMGQPKSSPFSDARLTFVTGDAAYMLQWDMNGNAVFGEHYSSAELKEYLQHLFKKHNIQL